MQRVVDKVVPAPKLAEEMCEWRHAAARQHHGEMQMVKPSARHRCQCQGVQVEEWLKVSARWNAEVISIEGQGVQDLQSDDEHRPPVRSCQEKSQTLVKFEDEVHFHLSRVEEWIQLVHQ